LSVESSAKKNEVQILAFNRTKASTTSPSFLVEQMAAIFMRGSSPGLARRGGVW
jgi:hypothetical protein